ncbi:MAG: zinc ribbon domain-containing protein [Methylocystis silviterrae]
MGVPAIIEPAVFDAIQANLKARNRKVAPPRVVTAPILLTDLAVCASCGGGMMLRTGNYGRYRYYTCGTCATQGKEACKGRSVPMDRLGSGRSSQFGREWRGSEKQNGKGAGISGKGGVYRNAIQGDATWLIWPESGMWRFRCVSGTMISALSIGERN